MTESAVRYTTAGFWRGMRQGVVLAPGVAAYGVAFGVLAVQAGLLVEQAVAMSVLIYSGSAQLATVNAIAALPPGASLNIGAVVATILLLNARYLLFGAALRPWLGSAPALPTYASLFVMGDGNWMLSMNAYAGGERDGGFLLGSGASMFLPWVGGTVVGFSAGGLLGNPTALGLDFLLIAFAMAMAVAMVKRRSDLAAAGIAAVVALAVDQVAPPGWAVVAAGLAGALVALLRPEPTP
jgi:predicted branched-subunit amino acid permease